MTFGGFFLSTTHPVGWPPAPWLAHTPTLVAGQETNSTMSGTTSNWPLLLCPPRLRECLWSGSSLISLYSEQLWVTQERCIIKELEIKRKEHICDILYLFPLEEKLFQIDIEYISVHISKKLWILRTHQINLSSFPCDNYDMTMLILFLMLCFYYMSILASWLTLCKIITIYTHLTGTCFWTPHRLEFAWTNCTYKYLGKCPVYVV